MSGNIQAIRGMNDILPEETPVWRYLEETVTRVLAGYGYEEIRLPIVEKTELFKRSIGEVTDIVEKEMYTFEDRNGDSLTLRPEGTAGCVRAMLEHGRVGNRQAQRVWYRGPMFRHERPQKGRYRQFHQVGIEVFGLDGPDVDAELILMTARLWSQLGLADAVTLQLNSLGSAASRAAYREILVDYLQAHYDILDEDSRRRLLTNPLRVLDSKNPAMQPLIEAAPRLMEHLDAESRAHFDGLCAILDAVGVRYDINTRLVRGLDYYGRTVFEWVTDRLGAQGTVCAGGRYDGLVEQLGGKPTPAVGFAMGLERLTALIDPTTVPVERFRPHAYLVSVGEGTELAAQVLADRLRGALPELRLLMNCGGGNFKAQMKRADRSGAPLALILGEDEVARGVAGVKPLRDGGEQATVSQDTLVADLAEWLRSHP